MPVTPNYSFPYPSSSDPVASGATNFGSLATAVDTTVKSLNTATNTSIATTNSNLATTNTTVAAIGAWTAFTPTITAASGTITSMGIRTGRYSKIGKTVHVIFDFIISVNGTGGTYLVMTKPITGVTPLNSSTGLIGYSTEIALSGYGASVREASTTTVLMLGMSGAPGYLGANNARVTGFYTYEVP